VLFAFCVAISVRSLLDPGYERVRRASKNGLKCVLRNREIGGRGLASDESVFTFEGDTAAEIVDARAYIVPSSVARAVDWFGKCLIPLGIFGQPSLREAHPMRQVAEQLVAHGNLCDHWRGGRLLGT
jgi:hypothetical protein